MWLPLFAITAASVSGIEAYRIGTKSFQKNTLYGYFVIIFTVEQCYIDILFVTCMS